MAIKAGNIVHVANDTVLIDRLQTAGPGTVNINRETVYEIGNYKSTGQIAGIPDLTFTMESFDVSCEMEAFLLDVDPNVTHVYDLSTAGVTNIKSAFKPGKDASSPFVTVTSVGVPCLRLESMSYRYGVGTTNAAQTASLSGDSLYYNQGSTYTQSSLGLGAVAASTISNVALTSNVATITTSASHNLVTNMIVTISGLVSGNAVLNGTFTVTVTDATHFTFAKTTSNITSNATSGTVTQIGQTVVTTNPAYVVQEAGVPRRTIAISVGGARLNYGADYTEAYGSITNGAAVTTVSILQAVPTTTKIRVMYASSTIESFPQSVHALVSGLSGSLQSSVSASGTSLSLDFNPGTGVSLIIDDTSGSAVTEVVSVSAVSGSGPYTATVSALVNAHNSAAPVAVYVPTVKPAAIRGRDIDVYVSPQGSQTTYTVATATAARTTTKRISVQSTQVDWRVQLQRDEEFGNYHYVATDFDVPSVTGSIQFKPRDSVELLSLMQTLSGVTPGSTVSANPVDSPLLDVQIALKNPVDGRVIKRLWIPDARFSLPGYSARAQQKLDFTSAFTSDQGVLYVLDN